MKRRCAVSVVLWITLVLAGTALGIIDPNLPPNVLLEQSDLVLLLEFKPLEADGPAVATVKRVVKGTFDQKELKVDLESSILAEAAGREMAGLVARGQKLGLLFVGDIATEGGDLGGMGGGMPPEAGGTGYLHLSGQWNRQNQWFILNRAPDTDDLWEMDKIDEKKLGCWNGTTDMLLKYIDEMKSDPSIKVPVVGGAEWDKHVQIGKIDGKVVEARPVDVTGAGKTDLYLASPGGDRLFRCDGKMLKDVTAKHALTAKSAAFAWGDFNGDGRLDLASWDGKGLSLHAQQAGGTFVAKPCTLGDALKGGCLSLATIDAGNKGRAALVAGTSSWPVLLTPQDGGRFQATALGSGEFPGKDLGPVGRTLVADLDGDSLADVLQLFGGGSLLYKGTGPGAFAAPGQTQIYAGQGRFGVTFGDYDADGLLDLFISAEDRNSMWHNLGAGKFRNLFSVSGEIGYHSQGGGITVQTGDFNNDGRQDILIAYGIPMAPHLFFNRGYASFGHAYEVDLAKNRLLPQADAGQQAGCLGDFNGDGALDMVLVVADGGVWQFPRKVGEDGALGAVAALRLGNQTVGPVNVAGFRESRAFGAWAVRPGDPGILFGVEDAGPVTLKWRLPGGKAQEKTVLVENETVRIVLNEK